MRDQNLDLRTKTLGHTVWIGGGGYRRRGKKIRGERFESVRGEFVILKIEVS